MNQQATAQRATPDVGGPIAKSHFCQYEIELRGQQVHCIEAGDGPPLLILPAAPTWTFAYRDFVTGLAGTYRCIAIDFPGFGRSPEPRGSEPGLADLSHLVEELIVQLDLQDLTVMVHDTAGCIGIGAAGRLPERIRGLIVADSFAWPLRGDFPRIRFMLRLVTTWPFSLLQSRLNLIPRAVLATSSGHSFTVAEREEFLGAFNTVPRRRRVLRLLGGLLQEVSFLERVEADLIRELAEKPALVLFGEDDPARHAGFERRWRELLPGASHELVAGQNHFPHLGAARQMCDIIQRWARRT